MKLDSIQALRGVAASFVVFGHSSAFGLIKLPGWLEVLDYSGVDLFFVISGFIIAYVSTKSSTTPLIFAFRRFWRVYSLYWVVLAVSVVLYLASIANSPDWMRSYFPAYQYILLLETENRFIPPAWTLCYELYFYAITALILFIPRRFFYFSLAVWMGVQAALSFIYGNDHGPVTNVLVLEFGLGCLVAWLTQTNRLSPKLGLIALPLGLILFALGINMSLSSNGPSYFERFSTFGIAGAFVVYTLVAFERSKLVIFPRALIAVGDASFSLYLWHWPLIAVFLFAGMRNPFSIALIYVVALISFRFIESPLLRLGRKNLVRRVTTESRAKL